MRGTSVLPALPLLVACASAGGPLGFGRSPGPLPSQSALAASVAEAHARLDSAAGRGDAAALAQVFEPAATVVIGNDTLRGFDALAGAVRSAHPGTTSGAVEMRPNRTEWCSDGAYEIGGTATLIARREGRADTLQPSYAVRWASDGRGTARIRAVTLQPQGRQQETRTTGCGVYLGPAQFTGRRLFLTVEPFLGLSRLHTFDEVTALFVGGGYRIPGPQQAADPQTNQIGLVAKSTESWLRVEVGARVRVAGPLSVEARFSPVKQGGTITGYDVADTSYAILDYGVRNAALLVGLEWRRFRISAGPVLVRASWSLQERLLRWVPSAQRWYGPVRTDEDWAGTASGTLVQAAYTWGFSRSFFAEIRGTWRSVKLDFVSPSSVFPSGKLDAGGYELMLAIGLAP